MNTNVRLSQKQRDEVDRKRDELTRAQRAFQRCVDAMREAVSAPNWMIFDADTGQFVDPDSVKKPAEKKP